MEHAFTNNIKSVLKKNYGKNANAIFEKSLLIKYLNEKTRSANRGSKARGSFANLYAIYVIVEDYIANGYDKRGRYSTYKVYSVSIIVEKYMACIEEIINIPTLVSRFKETIKQGYLDNILDEIILQSKVEFNYEDTDE